MFRNKVICPSVCLPSCPFHVLYVCNSAEMAGQIAVNIERMMCIICCCTRTIFMAKSQWPGLNDPDVTGAFSCQFWDRPTMCFFCIMAAFSPPPPPHPHPRPSPLARPIASRDMYGVNVEHDYLHE